MTKPFIENSLENANSGVAGVRSSGNGQQGALLNGYYSRVGLKGRAIEGGNSRRRRAPQGVIGLRKDTPIEDLLLSDNFLLELTPLCQCERTKTKSVDEISLGTNKPGKHGSGVSTRSFDRNQIKGIHTLV